MRTNGFEFKWPNVITCIVAALLFIPIHLWETNNFYFHKTKNMTKIIIRIQCMQFRVLPFYFTHQQIYFVVTFISFVFVAYFTNVSGWEILQKNEVRRSCQIVKLRDMECKLQYGCLLIYEYVCVCAIENKSIFTDKI